MRNRLHYNRIRKEDISNWGELREASLSRSSVTPIRNEYDVDQCYIYQPNGKQEYPDFMVFESDQVVCIETKISGQSHPVWNSGLPRPNGFYIVGCSRTRDITFFLGSDVVTQDESIRMHAFFAELKEAQNRFNNEEMNNQRKGFSVYIRKAFEQKRLHNPNADIDYYNSPNRQMMQQNVLNYFPTIQPSV